MYSKEYPQNFLCKPQTLGHKFSGLLTPTIAMAPAAYLSPSLTAISRVLLPVVSTALTFHPEYACEASHNFNTYTTPTA
jgi:hypothetical protein